MRVMQDSGDMTNANQCKNGQTLTLKVDGKIRTNDKLYKVVDAWVGKIFRIKQRSLITKTKAW